MAIMLGCSTLMVGQRKTLPGRPLAVFMGGLQPTSDLTLMVAYEEGPNIRPTDVVAVASGQEIPAMARRCIGAVCPAWNTMWVAFAVDEVAESATALANGTVSAIGTSAPGLSNLLKRILL